MKFLTYSEWCDKFGEKYKTPKFASKGARGVDVKRCQKIAASKNGKIQDRNVAGYKSYLKEIKIDLSQIQGENNLGEDLFKSLINFISQYEGREEAEKLIEKSGRFEKIEGRWREKDK